MSESKSPTVPPTTKDQILVARRIDLVDETGKLTLSLDGKYSVRLVGEDGRPKASIGFLTSGQPALMFFHGPVPRVDLRLDEEGNPDFTLIGNRQLEVAEALIRAWDKEAAEKEQAAKQKSSRPKGARKKT